MMVNLKDKIKVLVYKLIPPPLVNESFSQAGEDVCIDFLFSQIGLTHPAYLELGVCKPDIGSNTFKFYKKGARGVLVEADKTQLDDIRKLRPYDKIIHAGISDEKNQEADFYVFAEKGYNTFVKAEAESRAIQGNNKIVRIDKVNLTTINEIIEKNFNTFPDLLSIDIEGMDLQVIQSLDIDRFPIPVICAETCMFSENHIRKKDHSIEKWLLNKGYFVYADTYINTIFVNEKWFNSIEK